MSKSAFTPSAGLSSGPVLTPFYRLYVVLGTEVQFFPSLCFFPVIFQRACIHWLPHGSAVSEAKENQGAGFRTSETPAEVSSYTHVPLKCVGRGSSHRSAAKTPSTSRSEGAEEKNLNELAIDHLEGFAEWVLNAFGKCIETGPVLRNLTWPSFSCMGNQATTYDACTCLSQSNQQGWSPKVSPGCVSPSLH